MPLQYFSSIYLPSAFFSFFNYIPSSFFFRRPSFCMGLSIRINLSPINMIYFFVVFARRQNGFLFLAVQPRDATHSLSLRHLPGAHLRAPTHSFCPITAGGAEQRRHLPAYGTVTTGQTPLLPLLPLTCELT